MSDALNRLKVLINSSTPIVVMETSEETPAVNLVRAACTELNIATFEWNVADGLLRSRSNSAPANAAAAGVEKTSGWAQVGRSPAQARTILSPNSGEAERVDASDYVGPECAGSRFACRLPKRDVQHARAGAGAGQHGMDDG